MSVLEVRIGEPVKTSLARFGQTLSAAKAGKKVKPYFGIGFRTMAQFGGVFTPKRWELVEFLKASGPLTIYADANGEMKLADLIDELRDGEAVASHLKDRNSGEAHAKRDSAHHVK